MFETGVHDSKKKVGIMGGTFDPIHNAHLSLGQCALNQLSLDEVWFMPAKDPYFKKNKKVTPAKQRCEMTSLAVSGVERFYPPSIPRNAIADKAVELLPKYV